MLVSNPLALACTGSASGSASCDIRVLHEFKLYLPQLTVVIYCGNLLPTYK